MKWIIATAGIVAAVAGFLFLDYLLPGKRVGADAPVAAAHPEKTTAERIAEARARSGRAKGVYMTSAVANDPGRPAAKLRNDIVTLLDTTELNAVVIDVKETDGGAIITNRLRDLIRLLHEKNVWVIARQAVFKDSSQEAAHPGWYIKRSDGRLPAGQAGIWRDNRGGSWLDPASPEVWAYEVAVAKAASDVGFDEIQFDYVRFPSDGDVIHAVYPIYRPSAPKWVVLKAFFGYIHDHLKEHRPELILSADLFGYVALQRADLGIGQRLADIGGNFDYVSLMVYPSHYYAGFQVAADPVRGLPALFYPYRAPSISNVAPNHPYDVVYRSLLVAADALAGRPATGTATSLTATSSPVVAPMPAPSSPELRPWLQDFDLGIDTARGIHYDAEKVRAQIDAAEAAGAAGWLIWNPGNVYTRAALKPE